MNMHTTYQLGRKGESEAADFLVKKNYTILEKNYRYRKAEVDLIVRQNDLLVAIKIKTRSSAAFGGRPCQYFVLFLLAHCNIR